ncbi:MAG: SPOR domain-containing protein [Desulfobacterales bacterium]|nr:SPOR domain-containing protein [Desulfobacterales bacterium]
MFFLGVLVGRGNSPITFDTRGFQDRLAQIAQEFGDRESEKENLDLKFYDVLDDPVQHQVKGRSKKGEEILPKPESHSAVPISRVAKASQDDIPVKVGKKQTTYNKVGGTQKKEVQAALPKAKPVVATEIKKTKPEKVKVRKTAAKQTSSVPETSKSKPKVQPAPKESPKKSKVAAKGQYTIQVAAYKDFKDAVSQMASLEKKGIEAYRVRGEKGGATWYRVRTGVFKDYKSAQARLEELKQAKVGGMIIKKE